MSGEEEKFGEYQVGKLRGRVVLIDGSYYARFGSNSNLLFNQRFGLNEHGNRAKILAEQVLLKYNKENNLSLNDYRYRSADLVEMKLTQGYTVLITLAQFELIREKTWIANKIHKNIYAQTTVGKKKKILMHRLLMPHADMVDHINGTHDGMILDNRPSNLRETTPRHNSNNMALFNTNKSGVNGVHQAEDCRYVASWFSQNGKRGSKSFCYGPKSILTQQEAFEQAVKFRKSKNVINNCTNGERKREAIQQKRSHEEEKENSNKKIRVNCINAYFINQ